MKYPLVLDGQWIIPRMRGYRLRCCDCHLIHILDFKIVKRGKRHVLMFRARRDKRATAAARRTTNNKRKATV